MPDYDSKNIPVLDDIIEDDGEEKAAAHDKIIVTDEIHADDNTLDLFNESTNIEIDSAEPEIGTIDQFIDEDVEIDIEATETAAEKISLDETPTDDSNALESALIDYPREDGVAQDIEQQAESDALPEVINADDESADDEQTNQEPDALVTDISETAIIAEPASNLDLDTIIDDVVTQLLPELEQQLRTRLKQALQEQLPPGSIESTASE